MVNTKFWDDEYIVKLDPIEKLLFFYFLTNSLTNISGVYEVMLRRVAFDTGIDAEMVEKILKRFEHDNKIIYKNGWIKVINFIKNQNYSSSSDVQKGVIRELKKVPEKVRKILKIDEKWLQGQGIGGGGSIDLRGELNLTKLNLTKPNGKTKISF